MNVNMGALLDRSIETSRPGAEPSAAAVQSEAAPCADCGVRRSALCGTLADKTLRAVQQIGQRRRVARGQTIAWAGQDSRTCFNLLSGMFKLTASTADGREQVVGLVYPADFIGRPYAETTEFTVTALSDAEVCAFSRQGFEHILGENHCLERELLRRTLATLDSARAQMLMLARQSASERVADFLVRTADRLGGVRAMPGGPLTLDLPLSRGAIADVLGLTIETVSRQMTRLKAAGIIALPGGRAVTIVQRDRLIATAGSA